MDKVVDLDGKPHTDCSNNSFSQCAMHVESHMVLMRETLSQLIEAHNQIVHRIGQLEALKKTKKKRWWL